MDEVRLNASERKVILLASLGGALEFYDFIIYVVFAPIISRAFFPEEDKLASLMSVYVVFAIGYLARPLGGLVFSHFGDKYGRKKTFLGSLILMAVPTFLTGLLPTYQHIGIWASILLIMFRLLQGLSIGGEIPGALTFTCEHVNPRAKSVACGIIFAFLNSGILLGAAISMLLNQLLDNAQLLSFGWRIPFFIGGMLGVVGFYIRRQMAESPVFIAFQIQAIRARIPCIEAITLHGRKILQGVALVSLGAVSINLLFLFMPTYLSSILSYSKQQATLFTTINLLGHSIFLVGFCWLADRWGRRMFLLVGSLGYASLGYILFHTLTHQSTLSLVAAMIMIIILSSLIMVYPSLLVELFPTSIRYTGIAISYNIAFAFFGGLTPLIATWLIKSSQNILAPSFYLILCALFCAMAAIRIKKDHLLTLE